MRMPEIPYSLGSPESSDLESNLEHNRDLLLAKRDPNRLLVVLRLSPHTQTAEAQTQPH